MFLSNPIEYALHSLIKNTSSMPWKSGNFTDSCAKVVVLLTANIINTVAMKVRNNFFI